MSNTNNQIPNDINQGQKNYDSQKDSRIDSKTTPALDELVKFLYNSSYSFFIFNIYKKYIFLYIYLIFNQNNRISQMKMPKQMMISLLIIIIYIITQLNQKTKIYLNQLIKHNRNMISWEIITSQITEIIITIIV